MTSSSRAELLKALYIARLNQTDFTAITQALGYNYQPSALEQKEPEKIGSLVKQNEDDSLVKLETIKPRTRYWHVDKAEPINETKGDKADKENSATNRKYSQSRVIIANREALPESPETMPYRFIWSRGQWQNCWDITLPSKIPSKQLDIAKAVQQISRGHPIVPLKMKSTKSFNTRRV